MVSATLQIVEPNELTEEQQQIVTALMEHLGMTQEEAQDTIFSTELEEAPEPVKQFHITDANSANWLLKRIAETNAEISTVHEMLDDEVDRLRRRTETILQPLQRKLDFFTANFAVELEAWAKNELKDKRERSKKLLYGNVGFKSGSVHTTLIGDEAEIIAKLLSLPIIDTSDIFDDEEPISEEVLELNQLLREAVKVSRSILKTPLKIALEKKGWDGALPAGVDEDGKPVNVQVAKLERSPDSFYFTTELPK